MTFCLQRDVVAKVVADLIEQIKDHPVEVKSLELSSKLAVKLVHFIVQVCSHHVH